MLIWVGDENHGAKKIAWYGYDEEVKSRQVSMYEKQGIRDRQEQRNSIQINGGLR